MNSIKKIIKVIYLRLLHCFSKYISDEQYLKRMFPLRVGYPLDLKKPTTFNQKLQWLKLNDCNPTYSSMVDKAEAKQYVSKIIGSDYIVPTIAIYNKVEDINWKELPDQFVIKCTHDSGGIVICKDKTNFDIENAKKKLEKYYKRNYYLWAREFPYKNVKPKILIENFISEFGDEDVKDYKIHCFNGQPQIILVCSERFSETGLKEDFYDTSWNHLNIRRRKHGNSEKTIEKPVVLEKVLELSRQLSKGVPFLRTDFYIIGNQIFFGELTFFPASGMEPFIPEEWDYRLGEMLAIDGISKYNND